MPYIGKQPTPVPLTAGDLDDDIISLAKLASGTDGNLITYDASGNPVAVATGDDGQILTSAGAGQPCAFEAAAGGGGLIHLQTQTVSLGSDTAGRAGNNDEANQTVELITSTSIPANSTLELLSGNKVVMETTDTLSVTGSAATDVALSVMEIT